MLLLFTTCLDLSEKTVKQEAGLFPSANQVEKMI